MELRLYASSDIVSVVDEHLPTGSDLIFKFGVPSEVYSKDNSTNLDLVGLNKLGRPFDVEFFLNSPDEEFDSWAICWKMCREEKLGTDWLEELYKL